LGLPVQLTVSDFELILENTVDAFIESLGKKHAANFDFKNLDFFRQLCFEIAWILSE